MRSTLYFEHAVRPWKLRKVPGMLRTSGRDAHVRAVEVRGKERRRRVLKENTERQLRVGPELGRRMN